MSPSSQISHYRILAKLGEGGMGAVYRALDTKLGREVAVKVLPDAFASDPDRFARFTREAQVLASLNHPNIAAIYGVEDRALILELVEGEDLQGPLPLDTALQYARQIAEALETAHEKGIVHRDLKPGNIKVTPQGTVKVLDFGLAAIVQAPAASSGTNLANSPTLTIQSTQAGLIMGTAAYMSPEQASGKPVDRRADIWSFGVVVWEMLAGRRLFDGETVSHVLADVLRADIDFSAVPSGTPASVRTLLRRCLDRNVKNRLRDIGEARVILENPGSAPAETRPQHTASKLPWIAAAILLVVSGVLAALYWSATRPVSHALNRFDVTFLVPERLHPFLAVSPDGRRIAFAQIGADGVQRIYTRLLDQADAVMVAGTDGATSLFFSPDGQWLAFASGGSLKKVLVQGGTAVKLCDSPDMRGGSWGDDGNIVFTPNNRALLYRVPDTGGTPQPITKFQSGELTHRYPQVLPGSRQVVFNANTGPGEYDESTVQLLDVASGRVKILHRGGFGAKYVHGGFLVWAREGALLGARVDLEQGRLTTGPTPVFDKLGSDSGSGLGNFDISQTGVFIGLSGTSAVNESGLSMLTADGKMTRLGQPARRYWAIRISPDGKRVALDVRQGSKHDILLLDIAADRATPLTFTGEATYPVWAPDGSRIAYTTPDAKRLFWIRTDGSSAPELLFTADDKMRSISPYTFTPDGRVLIIEIVGNSRALYRLPVDGPKPATPEKLPGLEGAVQPSFSPDGRFLAYAAGPAGGSAAPEIFVQPYPATGGKWRISTNGGITPVWGKAYRELYYRTVRTTQIMRVPWRVERGIFVAETPKPWNSGAQTNTYLAWDMAPDGKWALVGDPAGTGVGTTDTRLTYLLHFDDELRRRIR